MEVLPAMFEKLVVDRVKGASGLAIVEVGTCRSYFQC
jgi:hypothetical protein